MKKKRNILIYPFILIGALLMLTNSCKKDDNDPPVQIPVLTTSAVLNITQTTASCGGNITSDGGAAIIARGVCWSTSQTPTIADNKTTDGTGIGTFTSSITGLTASTTYYARAYATNSAGTSYGNQISFTTSAVIPTVTTTAVNAIAQTTVAGGGNVTSNGGATVTARGVCWNTTETPTIADSKTTDGTGTGTFTSSITGLTASTTYYVRAYATNSAGTGYGSAMSFRTLDGTVTDIDGNAYHTVTIGTQLWMAENLKTTHYANGTAIQLVESSTAWNALGNADKAMCYYSNSTANKDTYGTLYTWAAAMNGTTSSTANPSGVQGACPDDWHLPSDDEWKQLEMYLGMSQADADVTGWRGTNEGSKLAGNSGLWSNGTLENDAAFGTSGFLALPAGFRSSNGPFNLLGLYATFWSATFDASSAWNRLLGYHNSEVHRFDDNKYFGFSIRCLKD